MRPTRLDDFFGHERILAPGKPLRQWIENDEVPSLIFWGPPGCGKTTLAELISRHTRSHFEQLSALQAGVKEIKEVAARAREVQKLGQKKTLLFLDEIQHLNKSQQDALLPRVEEGIFTLRGSTTENPSFEINSALLSCPRVIRLEALVSDSTAQALSRALIDPLRGLGGLFELTSDALEWLAKTSEGDVRKALSSRSIAGCDSREAILPGFLSEDNFPFKAVFE